METVRIDEPCTAKWRKMMPGTEGRFCGSCQKTVVDFTQKTDAEIISILREKKDEHVCGRFTAAQVSTPALDRRRQRWRWAATVLIFVFGASFIAACKKHVPPGKKMGAVYKPTSSYPAGVHFGGLLIAIALLFGATLSSCRRHVMGRMKYPVQLKAKTEQAPQPTAR